jgi:SpoVK/Ycf46/Vps4 family AAA+-type ATPase
MARADLLKKLFEAYQRRDDQAFRQTAAEVIEDERKKQHPVLANELQRILASGVRSLTDAPRGAAPSLEPVPMDSERRTPLVAIRNPDRYFDDIVLDPWLRKALDRTMREVRGWEILESTGLAPTRRLLFCGPSGCGKTATAEGVATELGLPMLYVRFDSVVSSLLGETAANVRKVFDFAERGQWVVFFDEFDAIGRSRDDATEHGEIKRVVNSFLQLLDNFNGRSLVIAATNFEQSLDPAIWRRFDDVLRFGLPDADAVATLVSKRLRPLRFKKAHVDTIVAALEGASFADAERVCLDIRKQRALDGGDSVRIDDVRAAIDRHAYRRNVLHMAAQDVPPPTIDRE